MKSSLAYLGSLFAANMKFYRPEWKRLLIMSFFMMLQNSMFFVLWVILFGVAKDLNGWHLQDMVRMYGLIATSVGTSLFFLNGTRTIAYRIQDGSLDLFLARPRAALPALLLSSSSPASLGDLCYGPLIWIVFGAVSWSQVPFLLLLTLIGTIVFTAASVMIFSLSFWLKGNTRLSEQLFITLIIFSSVMQHGQPLAVQLIMYTVMPAAFIVYLPTELLRQFDGGVLALLLGAAVLYAALAVRVFNAGLRRYRGAD